MNFPCFFVFAWVKERRKKTHTKADQKKIVSSSLEKRTQRKIFPFAVVSSGQSWVQGRTVTHVEKYDLGALQKIEEKTIKEAWRASYADIGK